MDLPPASTASTTADLTAIGDTRGFSEQTSDAFAIHEQSPRHVIAHLGLIDKSSSGAACLEYNIAAAGAA